jgi:hypothetical protein
MPFRGSSKDKFKKSNHFKVMYRINLGGNFSSSPLKNLFKVVQNGHSYDILGARMLWKPKEARILTNFIDQPV